MPIERKPCTIDGVRYKSEYAAAKSLGIGVTLLKTRLDSSNFPGYTSKHHKKIKRRKRITSIFCTIEGVEYTSVSGAARKLGRSTALIFRRLKSFDHPDYVSAEIPKVSKPIKYSYKVRGKKYRTLQEIGDMEGLTRERIRQKINSPKHSDYKRL